MTGRKKSTATKNTKRKIISGPPPDFDDDAYLPDDPLSPEETAEIEERIKQASVAGPPPKFPDIIEGVLRAGSLNIFSGPTHAGKSTLLADILSRLTRGLDICGVPARTPTHIGYVALDHSWDVYAVNFLRAGFPEILRYARRDDPERGVAKRLDDLTTQRGSYFGIEYLMKRLYPEGVPLDALVVIDPIHPLTGKDINDHAKVGAAMTDIGQYCGHKRMTVIGTAHTAKVQSDPKKRYARALDRAAGSTAIVAYAETAFSLVTPAEIGNGGGRISEWHWTPRTSAPRMFQLVRSLTTGMFVSPEEASKEDVVVQAQDEVSAAMLLQFFPAPGESVTTAEVVKASDALQLPKRTVERYLTTLYTGGQIEKVRRGVYRRCEQRRKEN